MGEEFENAARLLQSYRDVVRPALEDIAAAELPDADAAARLLEAANAFSPTVRIGFLGESQVGKSSVINALLGRRVLPSGGVGPLTAQATTVSYSIEPSIRVGYHGRKRMNEFAFALRIYLKSIGELQVASDDPAPEDPGEGERDDNGDDATFARIAAGHDAGHEESPGSSTRSAQRTGMGDSLVEQARKLFDAPAESSRRELFELIQAVASKDPKYVHQTGAYQERVLELRQRLDTAETFTSAGMERRAFLFELRQRATGYLAPLVKELHVLLDQPLLSSAELVDLPGVGVVGDPAGQVAEKFVREGADALVIVMRNNGLTEQVARLLESTGVITKLLFGGQNGQPPIHVAIVVTRLDDVVRDQHSRAVADAQEFGDEVPSPGALFHSLADEMAATVRRQITEALSRSPSFDDLEADQREHRLRVVRGLSEKMTVVCVSAPDYLAFKEKNTRGLLLESEDETNIPALSEALWRLSEQAQEARLARLNEAHDNLFQLIDQTLESHLATRRDRKGARIQADDRFRDEITSISESLRERAKKHRQGFMKLLNDEMPNSLDELATKAADNAVRKLVRLRSSGQSLRWATLNAALVRDGSFEGAHRVDYPGDLTRAFVDVIAGSWEEKVVVTVRSAVRGLNTDDELLIAELNEHAARLLDSDEMHGVLANQRKLLRDQSKISIAWTKEQLENLRQDVETKLYSTVKRPIERACRLAQREGKNRGEGARNRILGVFETGGREAIEKARDACFAVLDEHLRKLRKSLGQVVRENYDPVTAIVEKLIEMKADEISRVGEGQRKEHLRVLTGARKDLDRVRSATSQVQVA